MFQKKFTGLHVLLTWVVLVFLLGVIVSTSIGKSRAMKDDLRILNVRMEESENRLRRVIDRLANELEGTRLDNAALRSSNELLARENLRAKRQLALERRKVRQLQEHINGVQER